MTEYVERIAKMEQQLNDLDKNNGKDHQDIKECITKLEIKIDAFVKGADKKFASKLSERIVYTMVGAILLTVLYFILRKAGIE